MTLWVDGTSAILELGDGDTALELFLYFRPGGRWEAAWVLSCTGALLGWIEVGRA